MQIFWGVEAVYYGIVQVENFEFKNEQLRDWVLTSVRRRLGITSYKRLVISQLFRCAELKICRVDV